MHLRELAVSSAFEVTTSSHEDARGSFSEWFRADELERATGRGFDLRQANVSTSRRGVVRGIHYADVPPGQAKYVIALHGDVMDFVVDLRTGSPTFGSWDAVRLTSASRNAVFIAEGLGHAFVVLSETATVSYLVTDVFRPDREHGVNPFDPAIGLDFPSDLGELIVSDKDRDALTLDQATAAGALPSWGASIAVAGSRNAVDAP